MSTQRISTGALTAVLLLIPLAVWAERTIPDQWSTGLLIPTNTEPPTTQDATGTPLPATITADHTLTSADNPVILTTTRIAPSATLTIEPGVRLLANYFATLTIDGRLTINGTLERPVTLTTNEHHPDRQVWNGLIASPKSTITIAHATITHATPAITCQPTSRTTITHTRITAPSLAAYLASENCTIENSTIATTRDGIITTNTHPTLTNTTITAPRHQIKNIQSRPATGGAP